MEVVKTLKVENVFLTLGHKEVLRGLNLNFKEAKVYGLLGQNGAGKSTIAYLLMGLEKYFPQAGKIIYNGEDITHLPIESRAQRGITLAWQEPARYEGISVQEFLTLGGRYQRTEAEEMLNLVGLNPQRYLQRKIDESLSGGERKRIEMASVALLKPKVVIMDEPDSGIDFASYQQVLDVVNYLKGKGSTVIVITHNVAMFDSLDYAYLICNGVVSQEASPAKIKDFYHQKCDNCDFLEIEGD